MGTSKRGGGWGAVLAAAAVGGLAGCVEAPDAPQVVCGANTVLEGTECRGQPVVTCGSGTTLENGTCRPSAAPVTCGAGTTLVHNECRPAPPPGLPLPLAVDSQFAASGFMGDGEQGGITDDANCPTRPEGAVGKCHHVTLTRRGAGWGGVYWQYPEGNWGQGTTPGLLMQPTGTKVTFKAWGATGTEVVKFMVGMSGPDGFEKALPDVALTTTPTLYTIDLSRVRYAEVVGGFGWAAGSKDTPVEFYIDDIQWQ